MIAMKANQIMPVALMIAKEQVFAMHRSIVLPPTFSLLDGLSLGVAIVGVRYGMCIEIVENYFLSRHVT